MKQVHLLLVAAMLVATALGGPKPSESRKDDDQPVFITGSLIPRRVKKQSIGTKTQSPIRIIGRTEMNQVAPATTVQAIRGNDPSVRVIGR